MKTLHFGLAFNPRPATSPPTPGVPRGVAGSRRGGVDRGGRGADRGAGGGKWMEFLPDGLEEMAFGGHFNQPLVRQRGLSFTCVEFLFASPRKH